MKFSEQWLREWVNPSISTDQLCEQLTMAGLEVDAVDPVAPEFEGIIVAEVIDVAPHPDADKLRVCQVNIGEAEPLTIVCGAANVRKDLRVACAVVGAKLPGDFKIKKAKLRGVPSFGMLCSAKELGLAEEAEGLLELPTDAPIGDSIRDYLTLDDVSIELGLTPNRSDCLGVAGIAREAAVLNQCDVTEPVIESVDAGCDDVFSVSNTATGACPRYLGRVIRDIDTTAESPIWLQERLRRSGIRSLSPVVDVTNYVLLELGQPMHAFDLAKLSGGIQVRMASKGEKLTLLNGNEIELADDVLVIADEQQAHAMAGVMGGEHSAVSDDSKDIFLESAFFSPEAITGRARRYGLHTDSSHRFERGVSPDLQKKAIERATALLLDIVGGKAGPVVEVCDEASLPSHQPITLRYERIQRILGADIPRDRVLDILQRLGMSVESTDTGWQVTSPCYRFDIAIEVDLIEEVGRIYGYNNLPSTLPSGALIMEAQAESEVKLSDLRRLLVNRDYQEAITYSFVDPKMQSLIDPEADGIALANPISSELSVMRTSLWPGLLQAVSYNQNRQQDRIRLFESGLRFVRQGNEIKQESVLSAAIFGSRLPEQWGGHKVLVDFFDLKADVESLLEMTGRSTEVSYLKSDHPALHPGQAAQIIIGGKTIGWMGALHPNLQKAFDLPSQAYLFEIELAPFLKGNVPKFAELSKFPAIRRDIAIIVDEEISSGAVQKCVKQAAPETLQDLQLFDVYTGEGIDSGRKSLALGLTLQAHSRTLKDSEVDSAMTQIMAALESELKARMRE